MHQAGFVHSTMQTITIVSIQQTVPNVLTQRFGYMMHHVCVCITVKTLLDVASAIVDCDQIFLHHIQLLKAVRMLRISDVSYMLHQPQLVLYRPTQPFSCTELWSFSSL